MKLQKFILNMKPYAAPRPRAAYMNGRVRSYMPSKYTKWKQAAVQSFLAQYDGKPFDSPVKIKITFIYLDFTSESVDEPVKPELDLHKS